MFKNKKLFEKEKITVQKFKPFFVTVDGIEHEGLNYKWGITNRLLCTIPEYIMIDIEENGYIKDKNEIMYPLTNIVSIEWKLLEEKIIEDNFSKYQIFVTTKELENT